MSIESYLSAIVGEVTNQADQLEIARTKLLNKAAGGGGIENVLIQEYTPTDYEANVTWHFETDKKFAVACVMTNAKYEDADESHRVLATATLCSLSDTQAFGVCYGFTPTADASNNNTVTSLTGNSQRGALNVVQTPDGYDLSWVLGTRYPNYLAPNKIYTIMLRVI